MKTESDDKISMKFEVRKLTFLEKMQRNYDSKAVDTMIRRLIVAVNKSSNSDNLRAVAYNNLVDLRELRILKGV